MREGVWGNSDNVYLSNPLSFFNPEFCIFFEGEQTKYIGRLQIRKNTRCEREYRAI